MVVATKGMPGGAAALYFPDLFWRFCHNLERMELYILPSSREELLIVNVDHMSDDGRLTSSQVQELAEMVAAVNATQVDPVLQLEPVVYRYDMIENQIEIAARAKAICEEVA